MEISKEQHKAAGELVDLVAAAIGDCGRVHAATAVSCCARLAGSFLLRSFSFPMDNMTPGSVLLSEEANEKGPALVNILGWALSNLGINIDASKMDEAPKDQPNLNFIDSLNLLQDKAATIMRDNKLGFEQMAYSCTLATAFMIKECEQALAADPAFNTAIYGFIEGSKTCPPALSAEGAPQKGNQPV